MYSTTLFFHFRSAHKESSAAIVSANVFQLTFSGPEWTSISTNPSTSAAGGQRFHSSSAIFIRDRHTADVIETLRLKGRHVLCKQRAIMLLFAAVV